LGGSEQGGDQGASPREIEAHNPPPLVAARVGGGEDRDGGAPGMATRDLSGGSQKADLIPPGKLAKRGAGKGITRLWERGRAGCKEGGSTAVSRLDSMGGAGDLGSAARSGERCALTENQSYSDPYVGSQRTHLDSWTRSFPPRKYSPSSCCVGILETRPLLSTHQQAHHAQIRRCSAPHTGNCDREGA
jgi:hypothetical protein